VIDCLCEVGEALLAYSRGTTPDFLLVELHNGRLRVSVDDGSGNATWKGRRRLDDSSWHLLVLRQRGQKRFSVAVDDRPPPGELTLEDHQRNVFDMFGPLYVGGLPAHLLTSRRPHGLTSGRPISGFVGCLATLTVNGALFDPAAAPLPPSAVAGCRS